MSSLPGHATITRRAVEALAAGGDPVFTALAPARVAARVVARDIRDLLTLGHWRNAAQCRHFMRRFDGQSEREAYEEAVGWIRRRATEAARLLALQLGKAPAATRPDPGIGGRHRVAPSQALGDALHALQDSFAPGHAERDAGGGGPYPGAIRRIFRYAGVEKTDHAAGDVAWCGPGADGLSDAGRQAVRASRELLGLIADTARAASAGDPIALDGFDGFREKWLAVADALRSERDRPIGFLSRFR